jgi:hypothetical protein
MIPDARFFLSAHSETSREMSVCVRTVCQIFDSVRHCPAQALLLTAHQSSFFQ